MASPLPSWQIRALGIGQLIGSPVDRLRPYEAMTNVHVLVDKTTYFSFPSDHATAVGAVAVGLLFANRRWGIVATVLALLMAFTRVYVGAHYPTDVCRWPRARRPRRRSRMVHSGARPVPEGRLADGRPLAAARHARRAACWGELIPVRYVSR